LQNGFSPSELLTGYRLRTKVPATPSDLKPNVQDTDQQRVQLREDEYRSKQQIYHDKRHQARALPPLTTGEQVWVRDQNREGQIIGATKLLSSYLVKTDMSTLRRNRSALVPTSSKPAFPSDGLTVAPRNHVLLMDQTPPQVCTIARENLPAEPSTPTGSTTAVSTQEGHPNTGHSLMERVTWSGRVIKPPQWLDL